MENALPDLPAGLPERGAILLERYPGWIDLDNARAQYLFNVRTVYGECAKPLITCELTDTPDNQLRVNNELGQRIKTETAKRAVIIDLRQSGWIMRDPVGRCCEVERQLVQLLIDCGVVVSKMAALNQIKGSFTLYQPGQDAQHDSVCLKPYLPEADR
jgi:hypothetical protein